MLVDDLTVSGLLRVLREMQADKLTCDQINEISGEDLSTLVQNLSDISDKLSTIQNTIDQCETDASTFKTGIADAIKGVDSTATVTGDSSLPDFTSGIQNILPNVTSDATAAAGHILSGKTAYVNGNKVTGTIASKAAATYTPGTSNQIIAAGQYLSGAQTIAGDADLVAGNIKKGVNIFGVTGTFTSDATATASLIASGKTAYVNGNKVTGTLAYYDSEQPAHHIGQYNGGLYLYAPNNGTVDGWEPCIITRSIYTPLSNLGNASTSNVLSGSTFTSSAGVNVAGTMTNFGSGVYQGGDCGIYNNTNFCISTGRSGYIDKAWIYMPFSNVANTLGITASTIAKGYTICGVTGTFTSDATATAGHILSGKTAYVNGSKVTGTMNNYTGVVTHIDYSRIANNRVEFACAAGYHGCYWAGNSYEYMTYDEVLNLIGCSADKIVSGKSVLNRAGTGANGYNCRTWTYTAAVGGSSGFTLLGGSKTLSSSSWINAASSTHNSYYNGQIDDLRGKINSSSFAVCKISGVDHEIRRTNGYASGSTNASYRYFHDIAIFANTYSDSGNWTVLAGGAGVSSSISSSTKYYPIIYGYWADANKDGGSSSGGSFQDIVFCIDTQGAVEVAFRADRTNVLSFKGALKFEFWVFYK